jgi:3'(2'), 5'-bisphosphate nucleotidase
MNADRLRGLDGPLDDAELAARIAHNAGVVLVRLRTELADETPGRRGDIADREADRVILAAIADARPDDAVLSEESVDDRTRVHRNRVWIVDPLDGTREYAQTGRDDWAVHVALWEDGALRAGAVALPARGRVYATGSPLPTLGKVPARPRIVVSRSRPQPVAAKVAEAVGAEVVAIGSAGAKAMAVVEGDAEIYVHAGGQYEWDSAAPVAVARAAGLHTSRLDGSPLRYNSPDPWLPDLVICRPELASSVLAVTAAPSR